MTKMTKKKKRVFISAIAVLLAAAAVYLIFFSSLFWYNRMQPNHIPERRSYQDEVQTGTDMPVDKYGIWPTEDFTPGQAPKWLRPGWIKTFYAKTVYNENDWMDGFLVLRGGKVLFEEYYNGYDADTPHYMASVTKSVVSALVGIAIGEGYIHGIEDKVLDYFPEAPSLLGWEESKRDMTIEHLLTMTSGITTDNDDDAWDGYFAENQKDSALYAFLLPQAYAPGKKYSYDSMVPCILLGIIERASGQNLLDYANEKLFGPLGMDSVEWGTTADGLPIGGFGIDMTPRDMARFGYLYLNYGRWEEQQVIPADYVVRTPPRSIGPTAYGYMFWNNRRMPFTGSYEANGADGQFICIAPFLDMVYVCTGSHKN